MSVRCKFTCNFIDRNNKTVYLSPVYTGSPENEQFFQATPGGQIAFYTVNDLALAQFQEGKEYYVDFTRADALAVNVVSSAPSVTAGPTTTTGPVTGSSTASAPPTVDTQHPHVTLADGRIVPVAGFMADYGAQYDSGSLSSISSIVGVDYTDASAARAEAIKLNIAGKQAYWKTVRKASGKYRLEPVNQQAGWVPELGDADDYVPNPADFTPPADTVERIETPLTAEDLARRGGGQ